MLEVRSSTVSGEGFGWTITLSNPKPQGKICVGDCHWQKQQLGGGRSLDGLFCYDPQAMKLKVWVPNGLEFEINITLLHFNLHALFGVGRYTNDSSGGFGERDQPKRNEIYWNVLKWGGPMP
jgi:hypothetical protein